MVNFSDGGFVTSDFRGSDASLLFCVGTLLLGAEILLLTDDDVAIDDNDGVCDEVVVPCDDG